MPVVVGIDEAGYGPTLGPLVAAATAWLIPPKLVAADLWETLGECVCRSPKRGDWRLAVDDSKAAFDRKTGICTLERTVLAFAQAAAMPLATLHELLVAAGGDVWKLSGGAPWYVDLGVALPLDRIHSKFDAVAERLRSTFDAAGLRCTALRTRVVGEDHFNRRVAATRNKAAVLLEQVLALIDEAGRLAGDADLHVHVDRLGGRGEYGSLLRSAFPDRHLHVLEQGDDISRYRLAAGASDWWIDFSVEADQKHLPVALASMFAKYVRETLMSRFNAFWRTLLPELRPTAGYYTDAQRFLADIAAIIPRSGLAPEQFVRQR